MKVITYMALNQSHITMKTGTYNVIINFKIGTTFELSTFLTIFDQVVEVTDPVEIKNGWQILISQARPRSLPS